MDTKNNHNNKNIICKFFMLSKCTRKHCDFVHDINYCRDYYNGNCRFGNKCKYNHFIRFNEERKDKSIIKSKNISKYYDKHNDKHNNNQKNINKSKYVSNNINNKNKDKYRKKKNTQSFIPDHSKPDMRLMIEYENKEKYPHNITQNDVIILPNFFNDYERDNNLNIYDSLIKEMENSGYSEKKLWKLWHGDNHLIADDKLENGKWKSKCPTFNYVIERMTKYFDVDVKATRFNWYKDNKDWKPYHRDAAAIDERKAKTQNITIGMTFGATRTASFQHMDTKTRLDIPLSNGSIYIFCKQVNIDWMHGIIQEPEERKEGRISIIIWGKSKNMI